MDFGYTALSKETALSFFEQGYIDPFLAFYSCP